MSTAGMEVVMDNLVGVCYQGPIGESTDSVINRSPWPETTVLSTWLGEPVSNLTSLRPENLVINKRLIFPGRSNIRNQKISSLNGLLRLKELGVTYAWKIRSDFEVTSLKGLTTALLEDAGDHQIAFIDWVLHKGGYPMDFIQFGRIEQLIDLWSGVKPYSLLTRVPEKKIDKSFVKLFSKRDLDRNGHRSIRFLASKLYELPDTDVLWHKKKLSLKRDWAGNPVFCQLSGLPRIPDQNLD